MDSEASFVKLLRSWLEAIELPEPLWSTLYHKLRNDVFDSGDAFSIAEVESTSTEDDSKSDDHATSSPEGSADELPERVLVAIRDIVAASDVWLVDHAWTFKYREARMQLLHQAPLRERIAAMLSLPISATTVEGESTSDFAVKKDVDRIAESLWRIVGSYRPTASKALQDMDDEDHDSIWYVHDEVGSAISRVPLNNGDGTQRSSVNVKLAAMPVCFPEKGCVFSVMWVSKDMEEGDIAVASGDFAVATSAGGGGGGRLHAASPHDVLRSRIAASQVLFNEAGRTSASLMRLAEQPDKRVGDDTDGDEAALCQVLDDAKRRFVQRDERLTATSRSADEGLLSKASSNSRFYPKLSASNGTTFPIPFYTDSTLVVNHVSDAAHFSLVAVPEEARIMWMAHYAMRRSDEFPQAMYVSQLPEERFFTNKCELAHLLQRRIGYRPWFQATYDAVTELPEFIADFLAREAAEQKTPNELTSRLVSRDGTNLWIAKPCNLARSIDMTVSNNLAWLLRVAETGPKIFCKYISNPATLRGRKFDLRFVVAVRSLQTAETDLEAYVYDVFWTRFAAEQYSLDGFDIYAKHWTVMNYANPEKLLQLNHSDFIPEFNAQYERKLRGAGPNTWEDVVYPKLRHMFREVLLAVEPDDVPHQRFRGSYGVDVMIQEELDPVSGIVTALQPVLLEITFSPDCHRACKYHPHFFNDVFQTLFLGEPSHMTQL